MTVDQVRSLGEELPAHGAWVRELARSLVRDEAAADDLAQDAALAALRQRGAIRGALAPFLASVTRNFARRGWRDAQRRRAREELAARPEAQPATDEAAARLEIQRRLVEELSALAPELRHALVKRYFDGWSAARIAREANVPAPTVRWRLQRGLAELRARLDRKDGGDGLQWRLALLPLCGPASPWASALDVLRSPAAAGTIQGALTMKAASQAIAALTLVAAVGVGVWWSTTRGESAPPPVRGARARRERARGSGRAARGDALAEPQSRELVEPAPRAASAPEPAMRPVEEAPRVVGRCVDEDLVPVAARESLCRRT
jgi:RNA polymerase sigma factor (sigma-70 family)